LSGYLLSIIGTILISSFITAILPEGKTSGIIKAITRLACILAIVSPVLQFFHAGSISVWKNKNSESIFSDAVIERTDAYINYYSEMRVEETEKAIEKEILEKYNMQTEVGLQWEFYTETVKGKYIDEKIKITKLVVKTKEGQDEEVLRDMWEYLTKNYCSEVLIE